MRSMLIYAKYLQKNDVFRESNERPGEAFSPDKPIKKVLKVTLEEEDFGILMGAPVNMRVVTKEGELVLPSGTAVELLHRPHPGKGSGYSEVAKLLAETYQSPDGVIYSRGHVDTLKFSVLLEALQAYELGKPIEEREKAVS